MLRTNEYRIDVETGSELTMGYSAMVWDKYGAEANATVIEEVDSAAFYEMLREMLQTVTTPSKRIEGLDAASAEGE